MKLPIYQVDAFTSEVFGGNPAAVCPLEEWIDDRKMQAIAAENNLSETAFFAKEGDHYKLRWFTPACEVKLCGHATLASAFICMNRLEPSESSVQFQTRSGRLVVWREGELLAMDLPALPPWISSAIPSDLQHGLNPPPTAVWQVQDNYFAVYESEEEVCSVKPISAALKKLHPFGVCITAPGNHSDFVSRYFAPSYGIPEDPVTGSTHCSLTPYWSQRLGKQKLHAFQVSARRGELWCEMVGDRVIVKGKAALYLEGSIVL